MFMLRFRTNFAPPTRESALLIFLNYNYSIREATLFIFSNQLFSKSTRLTYCKIELKFGVKKCVGVLRHPLLNAKKNYFNQQLNQPYTDY